MANPRIIKGALIGLIALSIAYVYVYIPNPYIKCGASVLDYKNALLEKPEKTDSYYEALMGKKVRIVTSKYADRFLGQHPKVEETHKYVDAGFTQKTYIKVDGKEYWIFSSSNVKEIEEIDYIIDDVALDLWRQIKAQISCVIVMDVILIVFLLITIVKAKKKKPTASYISMNHFM